MLLTEHSVQPNEQEMEYQQEKLEDGLYWFYFNGAAKTVIFCKESLEQLISTVSFNPQTDYIGSIFLSKSSASADKESASEQEAESCLYIAPLSASILFRLYPYHANREIALQRIKSMFPNSVVIDQATTTDQEE